MSLIERLRFAISQDVPGAIRRAREEGGLSRRQLAEDVGCSNALLVQIEQGTAKPSIELLAAIAHVLDTTIDALVPVTISTEQT